MDEIRKTALVRALLTTAYIAMVASFMYWGGTVKLGRVNTILVPITVLMLFVSSAAICGYLVFGKPAQMYIDGKKKEALSLISQTLIFLFVITILTITLLVFLTR